MKLAIHLMPLAPRGPANSLFPSSGPASAPEHKFLHIAADELTIGELFIVLEQKCRANYFHEFEHDKFAIKKLQDKDGNDLPVEYTLRDLFAGDAQPITLKVAQSRPDRESSVPITSGLRPAGSRSSQLQARQPTSRSSSVARVSSNPYAHVNADTPIRSSESSPQRGPSESARIAKPRASTTKQEDPISKAPASQRGERVAEPSQQKNHPKPPSTKPPTAQTPSTSSQNASTFQFTKPALPAAVAKASLPTKAKQTATSQAKTALNGFKKQIVPKLSKNATARRSSVVSPQVTASQEDAIVVDTSDEGTNDISAAGNALNNQRDTRKSQESAQKRTPNLASPLTVLAASISPSRVTPHQPHRGTSSGSNISSGIKPMLPADVLESLRRRRRANGDDSDLDFPPHEKTMQRSSSRLSEHSGSKTVRTATRLANDAPNQAPEVMRAAEDFSLPKSAASPTRATAQKPSTMGQTSSPGPNLTQSSAAQFNQIPSSAKQTISVSKASPAGRSASATKHTPLGKSDQKKDVMSGQKIIQSQRKAEAERRAQAAEARKQELREEYQRQKAHRSQDEGYARREATALNYFKANDASNVSPKPNSAAQASSQIVTASPLVVSSARKPTGYLQKPSPQAKGLKSQVNASLVTKPETLVPASSAVPQSSSAHDTTNLVTVQSKEVDRAPPIRAGNKRKLSSNVGSATTLPKRPKLGTLSSQEKAAGESLLTSSNQDELVRTDLELPNTTRINETPSASPMDLPRLPDTQNSTAKSAIADTLKFLETSDAFMDDIDENSQLTKRSVQPQVESLALVTGTSKLGEQPLATSTVDPDLLTSIVENGAELMDVDSESGDEDDVEEDEEQADDKEVVVNHANINRGSVDSDRAPARFISESASSSRSSSEDAYEGATEPLPPSSLPYPSSQPRRSISLSTTASPRVLSNQPVPKTSEPARKSSSSSASTSARSATATSVVVDNRLLRDSSASSASSAAPTIVPVSSAPKLANGPSLSSDSELPANAPTAASTTPSVIPHQERKQNPKPVLTKLTSDSSSSSSSEESSSSDDSESDSGLAAAGKSSQLTSSKVKTNFHKLAKFVKKLDRNPEGEKKRLSRAMTFGGVRPA